MTQQDRTAVQYLKMTETPIPRLILSLAAPTILSICEGRRNSII